MKGIVAVLTALSWLLQPAASTTTQSHQPGTSTFTYNRTDFLLNGHPYQIIGGQMDPQRIPREYWPQRLKMARALGLNTIFSYIFWNNVEPRPGEWNFRDRNDIAHFFRLAQQEGLWVVLRPGPYVCAEHEWGGFPGWLNQIPGMAVRQNNKPFLDASRTYIERLAQELRGLEISQGGPILMTQLENEYGSFSNDKAYLRAMADMLTANMDTFLYTNDGTTQAVIEGGSLHGVLAQTDGDPRAGFAARDKYVTDPTSLGPLLDGEYYVTYLDTWASNYTHQQASGNAAAMSQIQSDLDWILANKHSFNLYMFHGGTNWGWDNGAIIIDAHVNAAITSYDYGAPLDESGRPTEVFYKIRDIIAKYVPAGTIPDVPDVPKLATVPEFALKPVAALFDVQKHTSKKTSPYPVTMEALDQNYGFVLYEHNVAETTSGKLTIGGGPRDRVLVYINGARVGIIDATYITPATVTVSLSKGDLLQLFVENLGRVDYGQPLKDQRKGIVGNVTVGEGGEPLKNWLMYSMPLERLSHGLEGVHEYKVQDKQSPVFYTGSFQTSSSSANKDPSGDTFLSLPQGIKGVVWVNTKLMGRYWVVGPQQSLFVPGCYLNPPGESNEVAVLELEPQADVQLKGEGIPERKWFNSPDPDAPKV